jgi:subtilase family serine protease
MVAAFAVPLAVLVGPASAQTVAPVAAQAAARASTPGYKHACSAPAAGRAACMALINTNVAHRSQLSLGPGMAPTGVGYGPSSLRSAYKLTSASKADGSGETVAIIDAYDDPQAQADLNTYRSDWGLPACRAGCFEKVNEKGRTSPLPTTAGTTGWDVEESLDIEMVSAICPKCHILLVEASSNSFVDLGTAVNTAVRLGAKFVSNSYGGVEFSKDPTYDTHYYEHAGVAITASSGDNGYGVEYPAGSQYVTAVGGTSLTKASNSRGWSETVWGDGLSGVLGDGTGSGCAKDEAKPSWQTGTGTGCVTKRTTNDVAAVANPKTGVAMYDSYSQGGWLKIGGTSVASPIIASVFALAGTPAAGTFPSSYIYKHTSDLFDVTSGSNGICSPTYLCKAKIGYDGPTGWGTPDGTAAFTNS